MENYVKTFIQEGSKVTATALITAEMLSFLQLLAGPSVFKTTVDASKLVNNFPLAIQKWNQTMHYNHTKEDLIKIRDGYDYVYVYRGSPEEKAEEGVEQGLYPYRIDDVAKKVAFVYGIPINVFRQYAPRASIERTKTILISSAPAAIAFRWAANFKYGEVMSDFNSHARMIVAAYKITHRQRVTFADAYDSLYDKAAEQAKLTGQRYTIESAADILNLPDKFPRTKATGAIVQIKVRAAILKDRFGLDAAQVVEDLDTPNKYNPYPLMSWNGNYRDMRLHTEDIISQRIVVRGIPFNATDVVNEASKTHVIDMNTMKIGRKLTPREQAARDEENKYGAHNYAGG